MKTAAVTVMNFFDLFIVQGKKFVEDRRKGLQLYLRLLMNNVVQNHEKIVAKPTKSTLTTLLPFFR